MGVQMCVDACMCVFVCGASVCVCVCKCVCMCQHNNYNIATNKARDNKLCFSNGKPMEVHCNPAEQESVI